MILATCPSQSQLTAMTLGELPDDQSDEIIEHIRDCPECEGRLSQLGSPDDTLIRQLQDDTDNDHFGDEPACQLALAKALGSLAAAYGDRDHSRSDAIPAKIGEYEIVRPLGRGGMSNVYLARHAKLGREVAVKVLASHRLAEPRMRERFNTEMRMVGSLSHPNIVTAYDAREDDGTAVLVTEYIDGFDVGQLVRRVGSLPLADACQIAAAICRALDYVNDSGMVHRDIKPSNIMVSHSGDIKLLDLGLARLHGEASDVTATGQAMGTADYIAPEQVQDSRSVDIRADIYALGCTLYKMLSGQAPFEDESHPTVYAKLNAHVAETPPSLLDHAPHVPAAIAKLVDRMVAKDPESRPQGLAPIAEQLERAAAGKADLVALLTRASTIADDDREGEGEFSHPKAQPQSSSSGRRRVPLAAAVGGFFGGVFLGIVLGIIITVYREDGSWYSFDAPNGSHSEIDKDGNAKVRLGAAKGGRQAAASSEQGNRSLTDGPGSAAPDVDPTAPRTAQPTTPNPAASRLEGVWRVSLSPSMAQGKPHSLIFIDKYFYIVEDSKLSIAGEFKISEGATKGLLHVDLEASLPTTQSLKGIVELMSNDTQLRLAFDDSRPSSFINPVGTKPLTFLADRLQLPPTPYEAVQFMMRPENTPHIEALGSYNAMRSGLVPADPSHPIVKRQMAAVRHSRSKNNLKQIGLGFHNFHDARKSFPPSAAKGPAGHPISWRVTLLPYLGHIELYQQYRQDEPWDSEHNQKVLRQMPDVYRRPDQDQAATTTGYVGFVGDQAALGRDTGHSFRDIQDGTSNTILVVESNLSIPWTKPQDIDFDPNEALPITALERSPLLVCLGDGSVLEIKQLDTDRLRKMITIAAGDYPDSKR